MISCQRLLWCLILLGVETSPVSCATASLGGSKAERKFPSLLSLRKETSSKNNNESRKIRRQWQQPLFSSIVQDARPTLDRIGRASKQIATHIVLDSHTGYPANSRILCLSGAACYLVAKYAVSKSEAAQRACYFWKRAGPIVGHYKFTQWWLNTSKAPIEKRHVVYKSLHDRYCGPSLELILSLKGLYVKIGQVMSSRSDFMPVQYIDIFSTLQDSIPQWPIEQAMAIVRDSLQNELGLDCEDVFESIDEVALGCASIGQVHRAVLKDAYANADPKYTGGKTVAIKIMHPEAKQRFQCDFQVFKWLTRLAMPGWSPLLLELQKRLMTEFDYHNEANNLSIVRENLLKSQYSKRVRMPQTYMSLCCKHILVMEMLNGKKLTDAIQDRLAGLLGGDKAMAADLLAQRQREVIFGEEEGTSDKKTSIVELLNIHGAGGVVRAFKGLALYRKLHRYIDLLVDVHGHQIFVDGIFNGDPHPGNIMELDDGRLGLIDFGQTKVLTDEERLQFARIVAAVGGKSDRSKIAGFMREAGFASKTNGNYCLAEYAGLFFDSDHISKEKGYATPQHYFQYLMETDPLINIPDSAIMVARCSLLFRGAGSAISRQVQTCSNWQLHANQALAAAARD